MSAVNRGLDDRLRLVGELVRAGSVVADIGADHGYLVCHLVGSGKCPRGFAADINPMPLAAAERHIREAGLEDRVTAVLSDGLGELPGSEIDDVVIAGMGGELIAEILTAADWLRDPVKRLILQPMTKAEELRRELCRHGFEILEERAVCAGRFAYTVMAAAFTEEKREIDEFFAHTGRLWEREDPAARRYLRRVLARLEKRAAGQAAGGGDSGELRSLREMIGKIKDREAGKRP